MTDFNYDPNNYDPSTYDPSFDHAQGWEWQATSDQLWDTSIDFRHEGDEAWINGDTGLANELYQYQYQFEEFTQEAYQQAWDAWNGPINAEGYTMHDASLGYTSTDTSFIEPASAAGSCSMITDQSLESSL